ncbi:MAG: alpha/beta fold hydrolase [Desulfovibrio desulfuricans]|jgi:pimeloyl-ACP methyl ester carboxylesterase|nr:alpha/beta fold hydrolase [Desulfovibrio desulfuricans]
MGNNPLVLFAHGKESGPWGRKILALAAIARDCGCRVESPDFRPFPDPAERCRFLLELCDDVADELILVGSSMGGHVCVSAAATLHPAGLFLMAPAIELAGYAPVPPPAAFSCQIIHAWQDTVVPPAPVLAYAQNHQVPLLMLNSDHTLTSALPQIEVLFRFFLKDILAKHGSAAC